MRDWFSVTELAERTTIPDTTIRRYIQKFPDFFRFKGGSRSRRFEDTAIEVLIRIKNLYDQGYESDRVDEVLRKEFPMIVDGDNVADSMDKPYTPELATVEDVAEIKEMLKQQQEFNKMLLEKLSNQERYINESLEKRDQLLLDSIRSIQEEKQAMSEVASTNEKETPSFFSRLFGKR